MCGQAARYRSYHEPQHHIGAYNLAGIIRHYCYGKNCGLPFASGGEAVADGSGCYGIAGYHNDCGHIIADNLFPDSQDAFGAVVGQALGTRLIFNF